jgi:hypothetical protein
MQEYWEVFQAGYRRAILDNNQAYMVDDCRVSDFLRWVEDRLTYDHSC